MKRLTLKISHRYRNLAELYPPRRADGTPGKFALVAKEGFCVSPEPGEAGMVRRNGPQLVRWGTGS